MLGYLTLSANRAGVISEWEGTGYPPNVVYTTPTTGTAVITASVPAEMEGVVFNSATLTYTTESATGTRHVRYTNTSIEVTGANLLEKLTNSDPISITFSFRASGGSGGKGAHSAVCRWLNITIAVDYSPASGVRDTLTVTGAGEAVYAIEQKSLAYGESCSLSVIARPTVAIGRAKAELRCSGLTEVVSFETERSVAANQASSFSYSLSIPQTMYAEMANRVYAAQLRISFTGTDGAVYTTGWTNIAFKFVKTRAAPVISGITWGESGGTTHISTYGAPIAGKTVPTVSFTVALDTDADSSSGYETRSINIGGKTYALGSNAGTLEILRETSAYTITVTDSYGQTGTATGTLTVLSYTPPKATGLAICRYESALTPGGATVYELSDDGVNVWFDAAISVQTTLGTGSNPWTLTIKPEGGSVITVAQGNTNANTAYVHDRSIITAAFPVTSEQSFTVELSDSFTNLSWQLSIPKAGGIVNIERTGFAVGMRSTGTEENPLFQCAYPAHFTNGIYGADGERVDEIHDTGWQPLTLEGCMQAENFATCAVRVKEGVVYLRGAVTLSSSMTSSGSVSRTLMTLPVGFRPAQNMLVNTGARANYSSIEIDADGTVKLWNRIGAAINTNEIVSISAVFLKD